MVGLVDEFLAAMPDWREARCVLTPTCWAPKAVKQKRRKGRPPSQPQMWLLPGELVVIFPDVTVFVSDDRVEIVGDLSPEEELLFEKLMVDEESAWGGLWDAWQAEVARRKRVRQGRTR